MELAAEIARRQRTNRLRFYKPYAKQVAFHKAGASFSERLFMAGNQLGKELRFDEPVLTPTGWVEIQHLKVGDEVIAGDGTVTTVTGHFSQGVKPLVEMTFCYGTKIIAGYDHQWKVLTPAARFSTVCHSLPRIAGEKRKTEQRPNPAFGEWTVLDTRTMRAAYGDEPTPKYRFAVPAVSPTHLAKKEVPVDPYVVGLLLGDGGLTHSVRFTSADNCLVSALSEEAETFNCRVRNVSRFDYTVVGNSPGENEFMAALRSLGLMGKGSAEKRIPSSYLWNDASVRLAVLQGLMDTDGTCEKSGATTFTSISEGLAEDVVFLARSFGAKCYTKSRVTRYSHNGEVRDGKLSHTVVIRLPGVPLFRLERKLARQIRPISTTDHHLVTSFKDAGEAEAYCISVAHPDRTYVARDFIVTHNTIAGGAEWAMHLTGRYPDWWEGATFDKPTVMWAGSVTGESTRDNPQRILVGPPAKEEEWGTGFIPGECIVTRTRAMGVPNLLDSVVIRWGGGGDVQAGESVLSFKAYEKGREKWQGPTVDGVWFDEEPPLDIYSEGLTRTNNGQLGQFAIQTFTPLLGMSNVVLRFVNPDMNDPGKTARHVTSMTIEDAEHYSPEDRAKIIASYPEHEREARAMGVPVLGSGRIFPVTEASITVDPFEIPKHWPRIGGLDFGWDHPTAAVDMAWDRDADILYLTKEYRESKKTPILHAAALKPWGASLPWSWPSDGHQHDKGGGEQLSAQYKDQGLKMLSEHATFSDGSVSVEAGLMEMLDRMQTGRWKVFRTCPKWFEEFRMYHREDGKVVKVLDDLISASRYAMMMKRKATVLTKGGPDPRDAARGYGSTSWQR